MTERKPQNAAGTRSFLDTFKTRSLKPKRATIEADLRAIQNGEARTVSCFLRNPDAQPNRFRQGSLHLTADDATWHPFWKNRDETIALDSPLQSFRVRPRDPSTDRNIKSGGIFRPEGLLSWAGFSVLQCVTSTEVFELAVPTVDLPLVTFFLERKQRHA